MPLYYIEKKVSLLLFRPSFMRVRIGSPPSYLLYQKTLLLTILHIVFAILQCGLEFFNFNLFWGDIKAITTILVLF